MPLLRSLARFCIVGFYIHGALMELAGIPLPTKSTCSACFFRPGATFWQRGQFIGSVPGTRTRSSQTKRIVDFARAGTRASLAGTRPALNQNVFRGICAL